jgi:hypothetical protein
VKWQGFTNDRGNKRRDAADDGREYREKLAGLGRSSLGKRRWLGSKKKWINRAWPSLREGKTVNQITQQELEKLQ